MEMVNKPGTLLMREADQVPYSTRTGTPVPSATRSISRIVRLYPHPSSFRG